MKKVLAFLILVCTNGQLMPARAYRSTKTQSGFSVKNAVKHVVKHAISRTQRTSAAEELPFRFLQVLLFILTERIGHEELSKVKYGWIHSEVKKMCKKLDLDMPPLRLHSSPNLYNAYASSLLRSFAVVVIGKGLIKDMTRKELLAVVGHELGHVDNNHLLKRILFLIFGSAGVLYGAKKACEHFDPDDEHEAMQLSLYVGALVATAWCFAKQSRIHEREADEVSAQTLGYARELMSVMHKFADQRKRGEERTERLIRDFWGFFSDVPVLGIVASVGRILTLGTVYTTRGIRSVFASHPHPLERAAYIKKIAERQEAAAA